MFTYFCTLPLATSCNNYSSSKEKPQYFNDIYKIFGIFYPLVFILARFMV